MYFNCYQNRASRSVKTVHIKLLSQIASGIINLQLPIVILQLPIVILQKKNDFRHESSDNVHVHKKIGLVDQSKPYTQIYLQNNANCINLQLHFKF